MRDMGSFVLGGELSWDKLDLDETADDVDAGFIVVGSHGAGNSAAPLLGSTSHFVVRNSHRPVIVIPPADNHPHRRGGAGAMGDAVADA